MASDSSSQGRVLCKASCGFFGSSEHEGYCSLCHASKNPQAAAQSAQNETLNLSHLSSIDPYPGQKSISQPCSPDPNPTNDDDAKSICSDISLDQPVKTKKKKKMKKRCKVCKIKLKPHQCIACRCGGLFCSTHRFPDEHSCKVDLVKHTRNTLKANNPVLKNTQMERIGSS